MKKLLALVLALVMTMSLVTISNAAFKDADKIDYDEAVEVMNAIGVLVGDEKGNFNAKENLTREQAAKIISYLLLGNKTAAALVGAAKFTDVAATRWSAGFVDYCASTGVVAGNGDGTFAPAGQLTGFQFAKMLLVALGYDAKIEGFTGTDWQINVSKVANQVGLFNGLSISGTAVLTREQAAQMCLNTLKAPLVQYSNKGGNISVNGAVIEIGASKAEYVTTTLAKEQRISDRTLTNTTTTLNGGYTVEFGEKYYPALELKTDNDDFDRPAHQWLHNNKKIGSYVDYDLMVAEYTTAIDGKELYEKLGSSIIKEYDVTYYVDGQVNETIKASNMIKTNTKDYDTTGKGVLTQVFVNDEKKDITIVSINTYIAEVLADYNSKKETLSIEVKWSTDSKVVSGTTKRGADKVSTVLSLDDFDTLSKYKDGDIILVTVAETQVRTATASDYSVITIADPEVLSNSTVSKFSNEKYLVIGGTQYNYAMNGVIYNELNSYDASQLSKFTYNVYVDQYGYVIGTDKFSGEDNYVFITGFDLSGSNLSIKTADAGAIFPDGTFKTIKVNVADTNDNLDTKNGEAKDKDDYPLFTAETAKDSGAQYNRWFTYSVKDDVYTLDTPANWAVGLATDAGYKINSRSVRVVDSKSESSTKIAYGNDDSVYITAKTGDVTGFTENMKLGITKVTGTYTGVQSVDLNVYGIGEDATPKNTLSPRYGSNENKEGVDAIITVYNDKNYIIAAVVVGEDAKNTNSYAYALKGAQNEYYDGDSYYWDFEAVVDGEIKTLTVKDQYKKAFANSQASKIDKAIELTEYAMLDLTYDKDGYVIDAQVMDKNNAKVYDWDRYKDTTNNGNVITKDDKVYDVNFNNYSMIASPVAVGNTLYNNGDKAKDVGLTIAAGAPIIVVQDEYDSDSNKITRTIESYSTFAQALNSLEDANSTTAGLQFYGHVAALLNDNGTASYVVLKSTTQVGVKTDDGTTPAAPTNVTAVKGEYANGKLTITLTGAEENDKTEVVLSRQVAGVDKVVSTYIVTGSSSVFPVELAVGDYTLTCGKIGSTMEIVPTNP